MDWGEIDQRASELFAKLPATETSAPSTPEPKVETQPPVETKPVQAMVPTARLSSEIHKRKEAEAQSKQWQDKHADLERRIAEMPKADQAAARAIAEGASKDEWIEEVLNGKKPEDLSAKQIAALEQKLADLEAKFSGYVPHLEGSIEQQENQGLDKFVKDFLGEHPNMPEESLLEMLADGIEPNKIAAHYSRFTANFANSQASAKPKLTPLPQVARPNSAAPASGGVPEGKWDSFL